MSENMPKKSFEVVWKRILSCEGQKFKTKLGLPFTCEARGNLLCTNRTDYNISKSDFAKAYKLAPLAGPGDINKLVRGSSYVYAILHDERISNKEW